MTRGALLFAFNTDACNYYDMAVSTAMRINHFLKMPVTVVTNSESLPKTPRYTFDHVVLAPSDKNNKRSKNLWLNKGRFRAYNFSPYDETLLLDVDYLVNSDTLLKTFDICDDFCCHDNTSILMQHENWQEVLSPYSHKTLWATVVVFRKTKRAKQIFQCLEMVQKNYDHYANLHGFVSGMYRNDYALTLALDIVNGHLPQKRDIIPWDLVHIGKNTTVACKKDQAFNTEYTVVYDHWKNGKIKKEYIDISDMDFHVMDKQLFLRLTKNE